jgi:hypothetical protein
VALPVKRKCLHDLGIARAESLGLSPSFPSAQLINHNPFCFETVPNLASKRSVEVMWQDENSLEAASFFPEESASKSRKGSSASSILRSADNSSVLVEHRCATKKIDMVFDDNATSRPSSGELQVEINSFSGLTLPGEVAGVGMIGPSFPGPTQMGRLCEYLAKLLHSYGSLRKTSVRSNTCLMCLGIRPVYMP